MIITIHYDFSDGSEISYVEGLFKKESFNTCCLEFFNMDIEAEDVVILNKKGEKISRKNIYKHTEKEIRKSHNIRKILISGGFKFT